MLISFRKNITAFLKIGPALLFIFFFSSCPDVVYVPDPVFSPPAGTYAEPRNVEILCNTPGVTIYYTLDGTDPAPSSAVYNSPIHISENTVIKAWAEKAGIGKSDIVKAEYIMTIGAGTETPPPVRTKTPGSTVTPTKTIVPTVTPTKTIVPTASPMVKYNYACFSVDDNEPELWFGLGADKIGFLKKDEYYLNIFKANGSSERMKELYILINTNEPGEYNSLNSAVDIFYRDESENIYYIADSNCKAIVEIEVWTTDLIKGSFGADLYSDTACKYIRLICVFKSFDSSGESGSVDSRDLISAYDPLIQFRQRVQERR